MEHECNKQLWLEGVLKKLYKKAYSLRPEEKNSNHEKKKINVPITTVNVLSELSKRKKSCSETPPPAKKRKRSRKKNYKDPSKKEKSEHIVEKFWNFVDEFLETRSFEEESKHDMINSVTLPSTVTVWKSKGILKSEMNSVEEETFVANKLCGEIQKARIRKATDVITKEILEERKAKKTYA